MNICILKSAKNISATFAKNNKCFKICELVRNIQRHFLLLQIFLTAKVQIRYKGWQTIIIFLSFKNSRPGQRLKIRHGCRRNKKRLETNFYFIREKKNKSFKNLETVTYIIIHVTVCSPLILNSAVICLSGIKLSYPLLFFT